MKNNPGMAAERIADEALKEIEKRNKFFIGHHPAKPGGEMDAEGFDTLIYVRGFFAFPLQFKSGNNAAKALREHYKRHPHIVGIRIRHSDGVQKISRKIERVILKAARKFAQNTLRAVGQYNTEKITPAC